VGYADKAKDDGKYLAALYNYAFAYGAQKSYTDTFDKTPDQIKSMMLGIQNTQYRHLWPRLYHSQAVYLYEIEDYSSAYRIKSIADKLEEYFEGASDALVSEENVTAGAGTGAGTGQENNQTGTGIIAGMEKSGESWKIYTIILLLVSISLFGAFMSVMFNSKI